MNEAARSIVVLIAVALPPLVAANAERVVAGSPQAKPAAVLDELLEVSGTRRALQSLPGTIGQIVMKSEKLNDAMSLALMDALAPTPFMEELISHVRRSFEPARARALLTWYGSPLGKRIVALTEAADKNPKELEKKVTQMKRTPPPPERLRVLQRLATSDDPVGLLRSAAQSLVHGLMSFVSKVLPKSHAPPAHLLQRQAPVHREGSEAFVPLYAASFETLSVAELQAYLDFSTSAEAAWFDKLERQAIDHAMTKAGERMGQAMVKFALRVRGSH